MSANWEQIKKEYETSDVTMKDLAEKHGVKAATLRSRKNREGWSRDEPEKATQRKPKRNATRRNKAKSVATQKVIEELDENDELNDQQKQFCLLYVQYFNASKAYKEAYGVESQRTAEVAGSRLLRKVEVQKEIKRLKEAQRSELYIDSLDIKKQWLKQAFADITDFVEFGTEEVDVLDEDGSRMFDMDGNRITRRMSYVYFKDRSKVDGTLIQEVKMGRDGPVLKLYDKQKAMQELMKFLDDEGGGGSSITIVDEWGEADE